MRKRTGMFLKQGLAVLLSLSMVPGPWSPGIVPAFAAQSGSGAATASDAEQDPGASAASSSDALFDEEGFLKDGEVKDDVSGEIIPESDLKTEKIEAMGAGSEDGWYSEYEYVLDDAEQAIYLTEYKGDETDIIVPGTAEIGGAVYVVTVDNPGEYYGIWAGVRDTLTSIAFEDGVRMTGTAQELFRDFTALEHVDLSGADSSKLENTNGMFEGCGNLKELELSGFSTEKVRSMTAMFYGCKSLSSLDLSGFDTSEVRVMNSMFGECSSLKGIDLSSFDTGNVTVMHRMFYNCGELQSVDLSGFDIGNVTMMAEMFRGCTSLKHVGMTGLNTANVSNTCDMFKDCTSLETVDMRGIDASSFEYADGMFAGCTSLEEVYAPTGLAVDVGLPVTLYDDAGTAWNSLPQDLTESVRLKKTVRVSSVRINTTARSVVLGKTFQLRAWPQPVNAENRAVAWKSSAPSVAAVDSTGLVTAVKAGTADVTATTEDGGFTAVCKITVTVPVTGVKINVTSGEKTIQAGKTFQLAAWPQPANATNKNVTWSSSNSAVAKVSSKGLVTAVKEGSAAITVKTEDGGKTAVCKITVQKASVPTVPVTSVKINTTARTLEVGKTFQLAAWPQPANATNKAVTWYSFNTSVATVSSTGLVTAKGKGSTNIRVMTKDGGKIAYCKVTVQASAPAVPVTSVKINTTARTLEVGKTFQLAAWPQPANATNKAVTWYSFNTSVATVSSTGLVTAKGKGSTNIRVMTKDGGKIAYCKITVADPAVIPAGYSVSAPTNVHWTDGFKLAWNYGKTKDGSVYERWAYNIYNAETGKRIGSHSKQDTGGTSIEYYIKSPTIDKMTTGSYYFTVYAINEDKKPISPEVRSELKSFTRPSMRAPKPYNLRWDGTKLRFELPAGTAKNKTNRMSCTYYYCETEDGTYVQKNAVMSDLDYAKDLSRLLNRTGYYKISLRVFNSDPRIIMPGERTESPVIHIVK